MNLSNKNYLPRFVFVDKITGEVIDDPEKLSEDREFRIEVVEPDNR